MTKFKAAFDATDGDWLVIDANYGPMSAAMVPWNEAWAFATKAEAAAKAEELNVRAAAGETFYMKVFDTPGRFEAVADTKYGVAW
jgi:hypothetical protein